MLSAVPLTGLCRYQWRHNVSVLLVMMHLRERKIPAWFSDPPEEGWGHQGLTGWHLENSSFYSPGERIWAGNQWETMNTESHNAIIFRVELHFQPHSTPGKQVSIISNILQMEKLSQSSWVIFPEGCNASQWQSHEQDPGVLTPSSLCYSLYYTRRNIVCPIPNEKQSKSMGDKVFCWSP